METYSSFQKPVNENNERIPVAVKKIDHLFRMASEIIEADRLHLFLLSDGTRIDYNEYLSSPFSPSTVF